MMDASTARKHIELDISAEQAEKLKRLAAARGCSEAEVIAGSIEQLPDVPVTGEDERWPQSLLQLAAEGRIRLPRKATQEETRELEALMAELDSYTTPLNLGAAIIEERESGY